MIDESTESLDTEVLAEKSAEVFDPSTVVSWDVALAVAQEQREGIVVEWKLKGASSGPRYQFEIGSGDDDVDVTIDAITGALLDLDD